MLCRALERDIDIQLSCKISMFLFLFSNQGYTQLFKKNLISLLNSIEALTKAKNLLTKYLVCSKYYCSMHCMKILLFYVSAFGVFLVRIFQHSEWIRRDTLYFSMFIQMRENVDQKNYEYGHFSRIDGRCFYYKNTIYFYLFWTYSYWKINDYLFSLSTLLIQ